METQTEENVVVSELRKALPGVAITPYYQDLLDFAISDVEIWKDALEGWSREWVEDQTVFELIAAYEGRLKSDLNGYKRRSIEIGMSIRISESSAR